MRCVLKVVMVVSLAIALWLSTGTYFHLSDPNQTTPSEILEPHLPRSWSDADPRDINDYLAGLRAAGVARLQGRVIANSGEYLPVEAPESFCRALQEFRATL